MGFPGQITDLDYISEGEVVNITPPGKSYSLPYVCLLRHAGERDFELLRSPQDTIGLTSRFSLKQRNSLRNCPPPVLNGGPNLIEDYLVIGTSPDNFPGWHYNKFGKQVSFSNN